MADILSQIFNYQILTFSLSEFWVNVQPLALFIIGITIYAIFVFKFYRFLAKRDIFELNLSAGRNRFAWTVLYILEYLIIFPLFVFFWFVVLTSILTIVSEVHAISNIFMVSTAIVASTRICAYHNEDLSRDLAKLLPFVLLGIVLIDMSYLSVSVIVNTLSEIATMWKMLLYYLFLMMGLEFLLRIVVAIKR